MFYYDLGSKILAARLPSTSNIIIKQDGKHEIKISRRKMVDPDKIAKEYERLHNIGLWYRVRISMGTQLQLRVCMMGSKARTHHSRLPKRNGQ